LSGRRIDFAIKPTGYSVNALDVKICDEKMILPENDIVPGYEIRVSTSDVTVHMMDRMCHSRMFLAGIHTFSDQWMPNNPLVNGWA